MLNLKVSVKVATIALLWTFKPNYQEIGLRIDVGKRDVTSAIYFECYLRIIRLTNFFTNSVPTNK